MDIKKIIREEIEKLNEEIQSDLVLPKGKRVVLQADNPKVNRGLVVTWLEKGGYDVEYWYKDPSKIYPAEVIIDGKPITKDGKVVHLGYHPELDEGFGSDEFLTKTEKKKFEKERLENAEVLGYTLTGTKDIKESINEAPKKATVDMMKALLKFGDPMPKPIWNALTMMVRGYGLEYVKREVKKNPKDFYKNLKQMARAFPEFSKKPKNYKFNEASLTIPQYKTSIKKLSHSQQDKLFDFLHKLKLMKLIDFINYRDGSLHIAKSSITPKIKKAIERKFKIKLKESINENRDFEKLYKLFSKKDYFGLKRQIKTQMGNYKRALKKGDKGAQRYSEKDVIDSVTRMVKDRAKRTYIELVKAIKKKDIRTLKSRLRHNQPYSIAIFNQVTGKKLPKTTRDIHSFLDNQFMKESVFAVNLDKEKNDERYPEQPNINYDPEKGKSRIRKIRK